MKRQQFINSVATVVQEYIDNFSSYDKNPQLRINPELLLVEVENGNGYLRDIEYSDEVVESAAAAERPDYEDAMDYQASQNFDYYPVCDFFKVKSDGTGMPDLAAIERLADKYIK